MPSYCIHLAVGNVYAKKHKIEDVVSFNRGLIAPDFEKDKDKSHYSMENRDASNFGKFVAGKVVLSKFLNENDINDDYNRGVFLHLVTDYLYFTRFFTEEYINRMGKRDFLENMYYSYDEVKDYVEKKYQVEYPGDIAEIMNAIQEKRNSLNPDKSDRINILPIKKLSNFIESVAEIDLDRYADVIKLSSQNVIPEEFI